MSRCTHGFRLQITLLNLSHRVPTPSVEPGTLPMDLLLQLENTYGLGETYKGLTPPDLLAKIYERNLGKYGDKLGPTIEWLRGQGKTWTQIIDSATRSGGKDLGF